MGLRQSGIVEQCRDHAGAGIEPQCGYRSGAGSSGESDPFSHRQTGQPLQQPPVRAPTHQRVDLGVDRNGRQIPPEQPGHETQRERPRRPRMGRELAAHLGIADQRPQRRQALEHLAGDERIAQDCTRLRQAERLATLCHQPC